MSETPKKIVVVVGTGEQRYVDLTADEIAEREQMQVDYANEMLARQQEKAQNDALIASGRAKLQAGEPLTEDEAKLLLPEPAPRL